jgi:hypothetical protein
MLTQAGMIDRLLFRITKNQYGYVSDYEIPSNDYIKHQSLARSFDELGTESKQLNYSGSHIPLALQFSMMLKAAAGCLA